MPKLSNAFRNFITSKKRYALAYSNGETASGWRKEVFKIKSHLSWVPEKDRLLYLTYNYFRLISKAYADYELGEGVEVFFEKEITQTKLLKRMDVSNIQELLYKAMIQKSKVWYCILRVLNINGFPKVEKIPITSYFCSTEGVSVGASFEDLPEHNIMSIYEEQIDGKTEIFVKIDNYKKQGEQWIGTYATYAYSPKGNYDSGNIKSTPIIETLEYLPLFLFNSENIEDDMLEGEDLKDQKGSGLLKMFFAESDYGDIMDIVQDINDRQSQISVEFIKHLGSKISLPKSYFETMQNLKMGDLIKNKGKEILKEVNTSIDNFDYITHGDGESPAQYITKDAGMLEKAFTKIERDIRAISTFTAIPVYMLGLETASGNRHVGTDEKDSEAFLQKIKRRRSVAYASFQKLFAYIAWILGSEYHLPTIKYPKLPNGELESKVSIAAQMKENGFLSQKSLVKFVNNFDDEEYDEEKAQMDKELTDEYAIQGKYPNLDPNDEEEWTSETS